MFLDSHPSTHRLRSFARVAAITLAFGCGDSTSTSPPAAAKYVVTASAASVVVRHEVNIRAQLVDANDNPVGIAGRTVTWSSFTIPIPNAAGTFSAATSTTNSQGVATVTFTTGSVAEALYQISALDAEFPDVASYVYVLTTAGPITQYLLSTSAAYPPAGADIVISAQAADIYNNPVYAQARTVTWSQTDAGGSFAQPTSTTNTFGIATVTFTSTTVPGTGIFISATDNSGARGSLPGFTTTYQMSLVTLDDGAGPLSSCGIAADGAAWCWGANNYGQLGLGGTTDRSVPGRQSDVNSMNSISSGLTHGCGVEHLQFVLCWGTNNNGELGDGTNTPRYSPNSSGGRSFDEVSAGFTHTCARAGGGVYCWGDNHNGRLGDGTQTSRLSPVALSGGYAFSAISAGGSHTCAITTQGDAYCWGANADMQLGDNSSIDRLTPVPVAGGLKFVAISAGERHTCGIVTGGAAYCWGADGTGPPKPIPTAITGGLSFTAISSASTHTCGITTNSTAWCWGYGGNGALGNGDLNGSGSPVAVAGGLLFSSISAGGAVIQVDSFPHYNIEGHTCGVTTSRVTYCWGSNDRGELGVGPTIPRSATPVRVGGQP